MSDPLPQDVLDQIDKVIVLHDQVPEVPEGYFSPQQYAGRSGYTLDTSYKQLRALFKKGKLDKIKVRSKVYYKYKEVAEGK